MKKSGAMMSQTFKTIKLNALISITLLLSISALVYARSNKFHSPYFDLALAKNLKLISKTEQRNDGFNRYVFSSSSGDNVELQMRVIVSSKKPENGQSLADFQTCAVANMSVMFVESNGLYQYLRAQENKKVLGEKPNKFKMGKAIFAGMTMYFGDTDASFLVTNAHNMTYAFTLISKNANEQTRKNNLKMLTKQLQSIRFNSVAGNE